MSRMTSMFSFTARTLGWILSARSTGSYFHRQDRMRLLFFTRKTTNSLPFFSRLYSTSAVGYTDQQTSRLYRPVSVVVSLLCSNSSCPSFPTCPAYLCAMCVGFDLLKGNYFSVCVYFDVFLPTSSRVFKAFSSCVSPFFYLVCFEVYLVLIGWAAIPGWMPL